MQLTRIEKRPMQNVGPAIWQAVELIETVYGGELTHDSGHDRLKGKKAATWIFTFPRLGNAQLALRMNKTKLSLYLRAKTVDGRLLEPLLPGLGTLDKPPYTDSDEGVAASLLGPHAPYLNPSPANPLLLVDATNGDIRRLLATYFGRGSELQPPPEPMAAAQSAATATEDGAAPTKADRRRRGITADELQAQLMRKSETGRAGELLVVLEEIERLKKAGCPDPDKWVERVAETDVGCGYDIETFWPSQERCIEVKSSTQANADIFITDNERKVLEALGPKAWLYRVVLAADGSGTVVQRLQDPMKSLPPTAFLPVAFRVDAKALAGLG